MAAIFHQAHGFASRTIENSYFERLPNTPPAVSSPFAWNRKFLRPIQYLPSQTTPFVRTALVCLEQNWISSACLVLIEKQHVLKMDLIRRGVVFLKDAWTVDN